jgi:hypothetical protein
VITVNGVTFSGNNISISKGKVIIDGNDVTPDAKNIDIKIDGNISELKVDACDSLVVNGNCGSVATMSGDVDIDGDVTGNISTMSGDVKCGTVGGSISTMSGDIKNKK